MINQQTHSGSGDNVAGDKVIYNFLNTTGFDPLLFLLFWVRMLEQSSDSCLNVFDNLPRSGVPQFVGRKKALEQLDKQLQKSERIAISTLTGMAIPSAHIS